MPARSVAPLQVAVNAPLPLPLPPVRAKVACVATAESASLVLHAAAGTLPNA